MKRHNSYKTWLALVFFTALPIANADKGWHQATEPKMKWDRKESSYISENCPKNCLARNALSFKSKRKPKIDTGRNPAADVCIKELHGKIVTVMHKALNGEIAVCLFEDSSAVDLASLRARVVKNR